MAKTIDQKVLKQLRDERGWSLDELASKSDLNKQTLHRLEHGKHPRNRSLTIERLCNAFGVPEAVLTGQVARQPQDAPDPIFPKVQFNQRIDPAVRNAYSLVSMRYGVPVTQIVELAPYLFLIAAERSLGRRKDRLDAVEKALGEVEEAQSLFPHLPVGGFFREIEGLVHERKSIEKRDLFGKVVDEAPIHWDEADYDEDETNPFSVFLKEEAPAGAAFEGVRALGSPSFRICREQAEAVVGGDPEAVEAILSGAAPLSDLLRDLKGASAEAKAEWAKDKAAQRQKELEEALGISDLDFGEAGK